MFDERFSIEWVKKIEDDGYDHLLFRIPANFPKVEKFGVFLLEKFLYLHNVVKVEETGEVEKGLVKLDLFIEKGFLDKVNVDASDLFIDKLYRLIMSWKASELSEIDWHS